VFESLFTVTRTSPYLVIRVRRDHLVQDALEQLQRKSSSELKKPLKVQFVGEVGVDEGGVQKEFFQLVIQQIFDAKYAMFQYDSDTNMFWFDAFSFESSGEYELIGIMLGLAIYNSVILDVRVPPVVYKKLLGVKPTLLDLALVNPGMYKGLKQLLAFDGNVEETYMRTFTYSSTVFGETKTIELKKGGAEIAVTNENRREYVDLYIHHAMTVSIAKQFKAFEDGFQVVCGGDSLKLFLPEELELLICGSPQLDFDALQSAAQYEGGFDAEHHSIRDFWSVVLDMSTEDKKKFLFFCTGSDRVPIKGLGNLAFVIARNGPDSDKLPTAHTCFNHLLLPEYASKDKLRRLLYLAIQNSTGFGLM